MNIYISNLSFGVTDADLGDLFSEYGEVTSAKVITDRETGRSRGFGFVEMANDEEGQNAIDKLDGVDYDGKTITVNVAKPREERSGGGFNRNRNNNRGGGGGYNSRRY
ncbi:RNA recognition motif-containing protein [Parabacteroides sp. PF5-5]|uniref:RNA recognition motif domain-containing protein n=1 Tax=unclassified Parabacteroides TaxID=2649774 RepID=UPI002474F313|nr:MULTISPECIES: RNA-binding protein [unclassified Parabacteroides]MDH6303918.1 RNA recognition motif-containing protein [Parabacteroides sp. PH5-39]MDH6314535.1 RNA recognition motif-containing protein [Parabacteroides sp. PF5-13]MDH6318400.1 RNA recognition motif-containing protein [Parabacteroides sp. PH5-13]MDH6322307.1 RNA recognition motif-containing protein [Parabacteroides sp. PH5-8]MDH6325613.1 RNA recognition motif-containing protein [Parabacteroides sp. PH5-41]